MGRRLIWFENISFLSDPAFWRTSDLAALYRPGGRHQLVLGLGIALLLRRRTWFNDIMSLLLILPLMVA